MFRAKHRNTHMARSDISIYFCFSCFQGNKNALYINKKVQHRVHEFNFSFLNYTIMCGISEQSNLTMWQFSSEFSLTSIH